MNFMWPSEPLEIFHSLSYILQPFFPRKEVHRDCKRLMLCQNNINNSDLARGGSYGALRCPTEPIE